MNLPDRTFSEPPKLFGPFGLVLRIFPQRLVRHATVRLLDLLVAGIERTNAWPERHSGNCVNVPLQHALIADSGQTSQRLAAVQLSMLPEQLPIKATLTFVLTCTPLRNEAYPRRLFICQ